MKIYLGASERTISSHTAGLGAFAQGSADAWTSPALPHISECTEEGCDFNFSSTVGSWIGSIYPLGCLISALLGMYKKALEIYQS